MTETNPYDLLGVRRRINAAGALTRLGGAVMAPEVVAAMAAASRASVDIGELSPRVDFIVTNLSRLLERVVAFYNAARASNGSRRDASSSFCASLQHRKFHADAGVTPRPSRSGR